MRKPLIAVAVTLVAVLGTALAICLIYWIRACAFDLTKVGAMPETSAVYAMDGRFYAPLRGEDLQGHIPIRLSDLPHHFIHALLVCEDARFYKRRRGGDVKAAFRELVSAMGHVPVRGDDNAIARELARMSFPVGGDSLDGKLLEAFAALRIERHYTKNEILERYINRKYFGSGFFGIEAASRGYFGKEASKLNLGESAMLVGVMREPGRFSPFNNPAGAIGQEDDVLKRVADSRMITQAQKQIKTPVALAQPPPPPLQENSAVDAAKHDLDVLLANDQMEAGGLKVYTTLDPQLQEAASAAIDAQLRLVERRPGYAHAPKPPGTAQPVSRLYSPYVQGAAVLIDNQSGGIRAMVGSRDHGDSQLNRAQDVRRQIASTFKPFMYAAAFQRGLLPGGDIDDSPIHPGEIKNAETWNPYNSDRTNQGIQPAQEGLILSRNTMSIRVGKYAGIPAIRKVATDAGIPDVPDSPYIFLGAFNGTLKDLTTAFTIFPNNGVLSRSTLIERIEDSNGRVVYRGAHITVPVLDPGVSWMISSTLEKVMRRGTASGARSLLGFTKPAGGKTGTTDDFHDAWFVGYTKSLTCGVWVGFDSPVNIAPNGYGAALALPIWVQVMNAAPSQRYPAPPLTPPVPLQRVRVCSVSNQLATTGCDVAHTAYEADLPASMVPRDFCGVHPGARSAITPSQSGISAK